MSVIELEIAGVSAYVGSAYSPQVEITPTATGHNVAITYKDAEQGIITEAFAVADGERGPQGATGPQGPKGDKGDTGAKGDNGATGPQGPKGDTGPKGAKGDKGDKGDTGATGPQGPQGPKGETGATGPQGPQGEQGPKGDTGDPATPGSIGTTELADGGVTDAKLASRGVKSEIARLIGNVPRRTIGGTIDTASDVYAAPAIALTVDGASEQDGTPTPSSPIAVQSIQSVTLHATDGTDEGAGWLVALDLQGNELRSLPNGSKDELTFTYLGPSASGGGRYAMTLTQRVGVVDMGDLSWTYTNSYGMMYATISDMLAGVSGQTAVMCDAYGGHPNNTVASLKNGMPDKHVALRNTYATVYVKDTAYTDADLFAASVDGVTLQYQLATPVTHDLGTVELPDLPAPVMTAWAATDPATSITLTYERDISITLDTLAAVLGGNFAALETSPATANHAADSLMVLDSQLVKATTAIAAGEDIEIGTNVTATTVAAELAALS